MFNLGDVFLRLVLGDTTGFQSQVQKEAEQAGTAGGKTMGAKFASALKVGVGAIGGAFLVGATGAASNFEDQLRTINTVAKVSDEQLNSIGESIKGLSRETGKTLDDLTGGFYDLVSAGVPADKAIDVLRNSAILATGALGTTGEAVDIVTSAMGAFDLAADQSGRVTDIFAQAVADGKTTVAGLAQGFSRIGPVAHAAGISLEEVAAGVAVMTLKGASASQAYTDMTGAINAILTPNSTLNDLQKETGKNFADIAKQKGLAKALDEIRIATKGDNEEFAKAIGGNEALTFALSVTGDSAAAMADELGRIQGGADKGGVALGQYTEKSKSAVEQGKRLVANIQSFIVTIGTPFVSTIGPAIFAINQLGQAFGLQGIAAKLFGGILGGLATKVIGPFAAAITGAFASAELGTRLETVGLRLQTLVIKGLTRLDPITGAVGSAFSTFFAKIGETSAGAFVKNFLASNAVAGMAAKVIAAVGPIAIPVAIALVLGQVGQNVQDSNSQALQDTLTAALNDGTDAAVAAARKHLDDLEHGARASHNDSWLNIILGQRATFEAGLRSRLGAVDKPLNDAGTEGGKAFAGGLVTGAQDGLKSAKIDAPPLHIGKQLFGADLAEASSAARDYSKRLALAATVALANGIQSARDRVDNAWQALLTGLKNPTTATRERINLIGKLASKELARGLKSGDPVVRATAEETRQIIIDRLTQLGANAKNIGKEGMEELRKAMKSKDPAIKKAAQAIYHTVVAQISPLPAQATTWGGNIGAYLAKAMKRQLTAVELASSALADAIERRLGVHSPAKEGPLSGVGPEGWGSNIGASLAKGLVSTLALLRTASTLAAAALVPAHAYGDMANLRAPGTFLGRSGIPVAHGTGGTGNVTNVNVKVDGLLKAKDPMEVAKRLQRFANTGIFTPEPKYE